MLQDWSFAKVALVSGGWVVACLLIAVAWVLIPAWSAYSRSSGSGGIGAVSFGVNLFTLAIPFGPPILLVAAWLIAQRR
jgi:hypothetical protein